jgi:LysR family nitrogen assimilation transcriptional regulator
MQAVLPDFIRRYPRVKLSVLSGYSGYVEDWLLRSEADLGLLYGQPRHTALRTESFLELEMFVVAPPHEAAGIARQGAHGWHCSLAELSRLPLILPGKHHGLRVLVDDALVTAGLPPARVVVEIDSLPLLRRLVSEGIGYSVLGHDGVRAEIASGTLSLIPIAAPGLRWCLSFACLSSRQTSPAAAALQSMTLAAVRDLIGAGQLLGRVLEPQR